MNWLIDQCVHVISLRRSMDRREALISRHADQPFQCRFVDGIDGQQQWPAISRSRLVHQAWNEGWNRGAIGSALSHRMMWRYCLQIDRPIIVLEDDVVLAPQWFDAVQELFQSLQPDLDLLLLGWNLDSVLQAQLVKGLISTSLFEPSLPSLEQLLGILSSDVPRRACRLHKALGLPGYLVTPVGAKKLLAGLPQLCAEPLKIGRGIPEIPSMTLDAQMNRLYPQMAAFVSYPPLVLAENDPLTSMTRSRCYPNNFGAD